MLRHAYVKQLRPLQTTISLSNRRLASSSGKRYYERKLINIPAENLYDVVTDVDNYHLFVPWCIDSKVTDRISNERMDADLKIGFGVFNEKYTSNISMKRPSFVSASSVDTKLFSYLKTEWTFTPAKDPSSTWVTFQINFKFKSTLYNEVTGSSLFLNEVAGKMVKAFETRCREVDGAARPQNT